MGLFDDLGNLWNDVEHVGSVVFHSMEDVLSHLDTLGVPFFASLPQFVQFIVSIGENPFTFLPRLVGIASGRGANPVQALEELAQGLLTEGPQAFAQKQVRKVIDPMIQQVQAHTQVSQSVGALHQNTITQVQQKLTALRTGNNGSLGLQGNFATALDTHFQVVQTSVSALTSPLNPGGSAGNDPPTQWHNQAQAAINQAFIFALEGIVVVAIGLAIVDLIILVLEIILAIIGGVITIEVGGLGAVAIGGGESLIDVGLIAAELSFIGDLILADAAIWAAATLIALAVYRIEELIQRHTVTPNNGPQGVTITNASASNLPLNPGQVVSGGRIYIPPKSGRGQPVRDPKGRGFIDAKGNVWEWAPGGAQHGGPHWDVQHPDGSHTNVAPNGKVIGKDNFPNNDSLKP